jgi:hypothetical protein
MEPPHLPTETLAASRARTTGSRLSQVPRSMRMKPQERAISLIRAENPQRRGLAGGEGGIRTPGVTANFWPRIEPRIGALFGAAIVEYVSREHVRLQFDLFPCGQRGEERHADWRGGAKLRGQRIGALPVVDGGHLVGILTGTNILDAFVYT